MRPRHDFTFYAELNPDRRLGTAHLYITISDHECKVPHVKESYSLLRAVDILEQLIDFVPGLVDAHLMLARVFFLLGNCEAAQRSIQSTLALDFGISSAHLLLAQVNDTTFLPLTHYMLLGKVRYTNKVLVFLPSFL